MSEHRSVKGGLPEGWSVVEDRGVIRGTFQRLHDSMPLANTVLNVERQPVALLLVVKGHVRELMQF